jgi:DNA invertase Pin-like site-specific DNA recombinase
MKFGAYRRMSTDRQAEKGLGLNAQEQAVRKWARSGGHQLVASCATRALAARTGLKRVIAKILDKYPHKDRRQRHVPT